MPATYAAARQVFNRLADAHPDFRPNTMVDLGAGTGACTWAAADAFPSLSSSHLVGSSASADEKYAYVVASTNRQHTCQLESCGRRQSGPAMSG